MGSAFLLHRAGSPDSSSLCCAVFALSPLPLDFFALQRSNAGCVCFLPARLDMTDRPDRLGPPVVIGRLPAFSGDDVSLSTCSVLVSDAFARGVGVQGYLVAGVWSGASAFFRHHLRPLASV